MQPWEDTGDRVHLKLSSADASTATALVAYDPATGATRTIAATEIVFITDYTLVNSHTAALRLDLFDDVDANGTVAAGERIAPGGVFAAQGGGHSASLHTPRRLKAGSVPKGKASAAGQVEFSCEAYVVRKWY